MLPASLIILIVPSEHQERCAKVSLLGFKVHRLLGFRSHYFSLLSFKRAVEHVIKNINKSIRQKDSFNTIKNTK